MAIKHRIKTPQERLLDVPMDEVGTVANQYIEVCGEIETREATLKDIGAQLVEALHKAKRDSIFIEGIHISIKTIKAKTKLSVTKDGA